MEVVTGNQNVLHVDDVKYHHIVVAFYEKKPYILTRNGQGYHFNLVSNGEVNSKVNITGMHGPIAETFNCDDSRKRESVIKAAIEAGAKVAAFDSSEWADALLWLVEQAKPEEGIPTWWKKLCTVDRTLYARQYYGKHPKDLTAGNITYIHGCVVKHLAHEESKIKEPIRVAIDNAKGNLAFDYKTQIWWNKLAPSAKHTLAKAFYEMSEHDMTEHEIGYIYKRVNPD